MSEQQYVHINTEYLFELSDGDPDFVKDIVQNIQEVVPGSMHSLQSAIEADDKKEIAFWAHKLKGTFRFVGIESLGNMLERIENDSLGREEALSVMEQVQQVYKLAEEEFKLLIAGM